VKDNNIRTRAVIFTAGAATAVAVAGGAIALAASAGAATSTPSATPSASIGTSNHSDRPFGTFNPGGSAPVRSDEKSLSAADTTTLTNAALAQVPGATVIRVETDAGDAAYEVHLKTSAGVLETAKFDKSMAFVKIEQGMGQGDPHRGGPGGPGGNGGPGDHDGDGPGAPSSSSSSSTTGGTA
jgi:hypothetical protein